MAASTRVSPRFRMGDWVSYPPGSGTFRAQVIEDRGPLGARGRRIFLLRSEVGPGEFRTFELSEENLSAVDPPDRVVPKVSGRTALHETLNYRGDAEDASGMPSPWYQYLVVSSPGHDPGSGVATIIALSESRANGLTRASSKVLVGSGGVESALRRAEAYLDGLHPGLSKLASEIEPT